MDAYLAQIYGTGRGASDDLEKTAQAKMLEKLSEDEQIDLTGLTDEQLDALAQQVVSDQEPAGGEAAGEQGGAPAENNAEEEAQAKFAEADFLGRVMAHSYTQELNKIAEEEGGGSPFPPKKEEKKCPDCDKDPCVCKEKEAAGPLASAISHLGGSVAGGNNGISGNAAAYIEKMAEMRAEELAVGWLRENGYAK